MLAYLMTLALVAQGPSWGEECDRRQPVNATSGLVVRGTVELSPGEADLAAEASVAEKARALLTEQGRAVLADTCPFWLPPFYQRQLLQRWLGAADGGAALQVVDRVQEEHDHGGLGRSYRTELTVKPDPRRLGQLLGSLRRMASTGARVFAVKCAGIVAFWLVLATVIAWLDRLSRGYMTWRLRFLGATAGTVLPAVVLLLI